MPPKKGERKPLRMIPASETRLLSEEELAEIEQRDKKVAAIANHGYTGMAIVDRRKLLNHIAALSAHNGVDSAAPHTRGARASGPQSEALATEAAASDAPKPRLRD